MTVAVASARRVISMDDATVASIETSLRQHPRVRRIQSCTGGATAPAAMLGCVVSWELELIKPSIDSLDVDSLLVGIDNSFPYSQPIIRVPPGTNRLGIPHVESAGDLCLPRTLSENAASTRVVKRLDDALFMLSQDRRWCDEEFKREFLSYWVRHLTHKANEVVVVSLLDPLARAGPVLTYEVTARRIYVSEDRAALRHWLANSNVTPVDANFGEAWFEPMSVPWTPRQFPETGRDVQIGLSTAGRQFLRDHPTGNQIIVYGTETTTGRAMAAIRLERPSFQSQRSGMSKPRRVPSLVAALTLETQKVARIRCDRADPAWVHGRDHDEQLVGLRQRRVAIVGLGALGGYVARLLAQAGVGAFVLVDHDVLTEHNTSRHLLGARFVGLPKADAVAQLLRQDFPHIHSATALNRKFEALTPQDLKQLATCDVVVSAGVSYEADMLLDRWRIAQENVPTHVCTWIEEFALAGHAVALLNHSTIRHAFDEQERVRFRLTQWPPAVGTMIQQAGCGDSFQPHGAINLQSTVQVAAGLALDVLAEKITHSIRRAWCGDRGDVLRRGGTPLDLFHSSNFVAEYDWV